MFLSLLAGILNGMHNNKWIQKPLALVRAIGKVGTKTQRVDVFNPLISPIKLPEVLLVVGALGMVTLHLGRKGITSS